MKNIFVSLSVAFAASCAMAFASNTLDNSVAIMGVETSKPLVLRVEKDGKIYINRSLPEGIRVKVSRERVSFYFSTGDNDKMFGILNAEYRKNGFGEDVSAMLAATGSAVIVFCATSDSASVKNDFIALMNDIEKRSTVWLDYLSHQLKYALLAGDSLKNEDQRQSYFNAIRVAGNDLSKIMEIVNTAGLNEEHEFIANRYRLSTKDIIKDLSSESQNILAEILNDYLYKEVINSIYRKLDNEYLSRSYEGNCAQAIFQNIKSGVRRIIWSDEYRVLSRVGIADDICKLASLSLARNVKAEEVGIYRVVKSLKKASVCVAEEGAKPANVMDTFKIVVSANGESENSNENNGKELREKLATSFDDDYKAANAKIAAGKRKIRDSAPLEHARDIISADGTTMAQRVSAEKDRRNGKNMRIEGERMVADGERMLVELDALKQQVKQTCEKVSLESADGRSLVCIVLKYELGNVIVLVGDKLYSIKESSLSEGSRLKIQPFKIR